MSVQENEAGGCWRTAPANSDSCPSLQEWLENTTRTAGCQSCSCRDLCNLIEQTYCQEFPHRAMALRSPSEDHRHRMLARKARDLRTALVAEVRAQQAAWEAQP